MANRREARLASTSDAVVPTRSLLGGVVNIQPTTEPIKACGEDVVRTFSNILSNPQYEVSQLGHMLEDAGNFGIHNGTVKFRDGGSSGLERMLKDKAGTESVKKALGALTVNYSE